MRSASYAPAVYRTRRDADPYGASRFDDKKARGEIDQIVLEHTLRKISYRIPKGRQPCDDVPNSFKKFFIGYVTDDSLARRSTESRTSN
ncbi:jg17859 [Pararge aegeria aegeria]|uniref:Jg17859 protein n=1 Tax=Pararge aegeria aegeria TaxID=348720 RepID=A0A8S4QX13_9NEOP|nr:jg17859 [Pararge aegeria aegeria]